MTLASADPADDFLTIDELAAMLRVTRQTIYTQRKKGTGPFAHRIGKHLVFRRSDVLDWLATCADCPR